MKHVPNLIWIVLAAAWMVPAQCTAFGTRFEESYLSETECEPRVTSSERDQMLKVLNLISAEKLDEAAQMLTRFRGEKASAVFDFTLANIFFQTDRLDEAAAAYEIAVEKYPKFSRAWRNLALIHVRQGSFEQAVPALIRVIELGGGDAVTYGLLGFASASLEDHLAAESAYRLAILRDPATLDWKLGLARSLFRLERFAEAAALCEQLIELQPDRSDFWLLQANAYLGMGRPTRAAHIYELLDHLGQSTVETLNMLGDIYINEELYPMAADAYVRAIEKHPDAGSERPIRSARILAARGAFAETRRLIGCIEATYGGELTDEARKELLKLRARLAVADGSGDEEAAILAEIVALDPNDGEALLLLGQYASRTGDREKAMDCYRRAAEIEEFRADALIRQAQLRVSQGEYEQAVPLLEEAQLIKPRDNIQQYIDQIKNILNGR